MFVTIRTSKLLYDKSYYIFSASARKNNSTKCAKIITKTTPNQRLYLSTSGFSRSVLSVSIFPLMLPYGTTRLQAGPKK